MPDYKIQKILNNNVVISTDENNNEIIVTGTGIGFRNHVGGSIDKTRISKIYTLNSSSFKKKFSTLINEIPYECIHLSERIIDLAKSELQKELNQNLILTLADHIHFAIQYHERGEYKPVLMNEEIKHFYLQEYQLGLKAVEMINQTYEIQLSNDEAVSIALHLISAELNSNIDTTTQIIQSIDDILQIIESTLNIQLRKDSMDYSRMVIHLKFFLKRVFIDHIDDKVQFESFSLNPDEGEFKGIGKCINEIAAYIKKQFDTDISDAERVYLLIHITRIMQTN